MRPFISTGTIKVKVISSSYARDYEKMMKEFFTEPMEILDISFRTESDKGSVYFVSHILYREL